MKVEVTVEYRLIPNPGFYLVVAGKVVDGPFTTKAEADDEAAKRKK